MVWVIVIQRRSAVGLGSEFQRLHLQQPLEQVADALVLGRLGVIAEQLTAHDLCP